MAEAASKLKSENRGGVPWADPHLGDRGLAEFVALSNSSGVDEASDVIGTVSDGMLGVVAPASPGCSGVG